MRSSVAALFASMLAACGSEQAPAPQPEPPPLTGWLPAPWGVCQVGCSGEKPVQLTAGYLHTCARMDDGTVRCWGDDSAGQLAGSTRIQPIAGLSKIADIAAGSYHTCALDTDGDVFCWGANGNGQLGDDTVLNREGAVPVSRLAGKKARRIFAGNRSTCAVLTDGTASCWGSVGLYPIVQTQVFWSQLGTDIREIAIGDSYLVRTGTGALRWYVLNRGLITTPLAILSGAESVASGQGVELAVMPNGELRGFGYSALRVMVPGPPIGYDHSLPYLGGTAACMGNTDCSPTSNTWATGVARAVLNKSGNSEPVFACLLRTDGTVDCWGHNNLGQLGTGSLDPRVDAYYSVSTMTPRKVSGLRDIKELVVGSAHACALDSANRVYCWGDRSPTYPSSKLGQESQLSGNPPGAPLVFRP
jgi:hypothetical protein